MKIGIVLLNYKNYNDTINCINSLEKQKYKNFDICVVDNFSNNNSIKNIKNSIDNKYKNIYYIENNENLGFAKGNNLGIKYLREYLNCDWIFVLNTDTIIEDDLFFDKISKLNKKVDNNIAVINPMCYDLDHRFSYPSFRCKKSIDEYIKKLKKEYLKFLIKSLLNITKVQTKNIDVNKLKELENYKYTIQGCSYFLTSNFFRYYDGLYPNTFLYCEELALAIYLENNNLKTKNIYDLNLLHKEGGSTTYNSGIRKKLLKFSQMIDSYKKVKILYKNSKKMKR